MANPNIANGESDKFCLTLASIVLPSNYHLLFALSYALLSVVTIFSNTILIYTLYKTKQFKTISNKLILVMNTSDLCSGIFTFPAISAGHIIGDYQPRCEVEKLATFFAMFFAHFSFLMLCFISLDRYLQITKLNKYNLHMNVLRMKVMIFSILAVSVAISKMSIFHPSFQQQAMSALFTSFGLCFVILLYTFLLKRLRNHAISHSCDATRESSTRPDGNRMESSTRQDENRRDNPARADVNSSRSIQLSAVKTIQFLLIYLTITYIPYFIMSCWWTYYKFLKKIEPGFYLSLIAAWTGFLVLFNASGNSWIIIYGNSRSRRFVSSLFRRNRVENDAEN